VNENSERIANLVSQKRIKLHVFEPSGRKIWTVLGRGGEHWLDPEGEFCSCPGYYYARLNGDKTCYHLDSLKLAEKEKKIEEIVFSDEEYLDFISSLVPDL
jgi:predicted nucleic acid-binding Zn finger protein